MNRDRKAALARTLALPVVAYTAYVMMAGPGNIVASSTVDAPSYVEELAAVHNCWTDDGEDHQDPSHALATLSGDVAPKLYPSSVGFDLWLGPDGEPGTGDEADGTLHYFCP